MRTAVTCVLLLLLAGMIWLHRGVLAHRNLRGAAVDGIVVTKRILHEKHPGVDDVLLLVVVEGGDPREIRVDAEIWDLVEEGTLVQTAEDGSLMIDGVVVRQDRPRSLRRLWLGMALWCVPSLALFGWARREEMRRVLGPLGGTRR